MSQLISSEQVQSVVSGLLGSRVKRVDRLPGSVANQDFVVETVDGLQLVVKAGPVSEIAAEAWACGRLTGLGVPVPAVVAVELDPALLDLPLLIARFVTGEPTSDVDAVRDLGVCFRRVHQEQLPGWGPVVLQPQPDGSTQATGKHPSWRDAITADLARIPALVEAGIVQDELAAAVRSAVGGLSYEGPGVLIHNDLKPAHVFGQVVGGRVRLSAVIDWGDASVGDPVADLARLSMAGPEVTTAFLDGYGLPLTDQMADTLTRYRVLWNVRALSYEFQAGGDWFDAYRDRIHDDTVLLRT